MARGWPRLIQDLEKGGVWWNPPAGCKGRCDAKAGIRSFPQGGPDVFLDNGCSPFNGPLFEPHLAPPTADDVGLTGSSDVLHPFTFSEHRHEVVLALIPGYYEGNGVATTRLLPFTSRPTCLYGG